MFFLGYASFMYLFIYSEYSTYHNNIYMWINHECSCIWCCIWMSLYYMQITALWYFNYRIIFILLSMAILHIYFMCMFVHGLYVFHTLLSIFLIFHVYMFVDDFVMWTFNYSIILLKVNNMATVTLILKFFSGVWSNTFFCLSLLSWVCKTNMLNYTFGLKWFLWAQPVY